MSPTPPPETPARPCPWMKQLLSALADGTLGGVARRYAESHVAHCGPCNHALQALITLRNRLKRLGDAPVATRLTPERRTAVDAALDRLDREDADGAHP